MAPERLSWSNAAAIRLAMARGRIPVYRRNSQPSRIYVPETARVPRGRGEPVKIREFDGGIERSVVRTPVETKRVVRGIRNRDPKGLFSDSNRLLRVEPVPESIVVRQPKAAKPRLEETAPTRPPEVPVRLIPLGEGRYTFETVTHDLEVFRDKSVEAVAEYLATLFLDPAFDDATEFWHIESDPRDRDRRCHGRRQRVAPTNGGHAAQGTCYQAGAIARRSGGHRRGIDRPHPRAHNRSAQQGRKLHRGRRDHRRAADGRACPRVGLRQTPAA